MTTNQFALTIRLLGTFAIEQPPSAPPALRRKTRALLAYLAAANRPQSRQHLADLFCQEADAPSRVLSLLLSRIRSQLGARVLFTEANTIQLNPQAVWVDYSAFQQQLTGDVSRQSAAAIETAVALYRGEFLEAFNLPDAPEFELWLLGQRAHARQLLEHALLALVHQLSQQHSYPPAIQYARQLVQHNPLLEEAHAQLIRLYAQTGQREAALRQYDRYRDLLQTELGAPPTDTLQKLRAEIQSGALGRTGPQTELIPPATSSPPQPGFVGRAAEMAHLQAAWRSVQTGQGAALLIGASAGAGKSRLVRELSNGLPAGAVYLGGCFESTQALPYQPWLALLESHWQQLPESTLQQLSPATQTYLDHLLPGLIRQLPQAGLLTVLDEPERLFTAIVEFLSQHPAGQLPPRLLFLDDLQWADATSLRLFHYISQRISRFPWLLLGAYRTEETMETPALSQLLDDFDRRGLAPLRLSPLTAADITELAAHSWPRLAPGYRGHIAAMLAQATGGNALFITAVLQELATSPHLPAELPVPTSVQALMQRRLRRLPPGSRQVLETLAVLGSHASLAQLRQISARSDEETAHALEWGLQAGLITADSSALPALVQFQHDLVREAVIATLSAVRRQRLHHRVAEWLAHTARRRDAVARQELAGRILYHARRGEAFELVFRWAPDAAAHACQSFAYGDALHTVDAMRDAFAHLQDSPDFDPDNAAPRLFEQLIWWLSHSRVLGKPPEEEQAVLQQAQSLLARCPSPLRAAQLQFVTAEMTLPYEEAIPVLREAHRQFLQLGELSRAALALTEAASSSITLSRNRDGRSLGEQALALYRQANDSAGEIRCLTGLAWTAINLGEIDVALGHAQQALAISRAQGDKLGEAQALFGLAATWAFYHTPAKIAAPAAAAKQLFEQMGFQRRAIRSHLYLGSAYHAGNNWPKALAVYEDLLAQATAWQDTWLAGWAAQLAGRIHLRYGRVDAAAEKLRHARQLRLTTGERQNQVSDLAWLGRLALVQGEIAAALTHTAQAVTQLDAFHGEFYVWEQPDVLMCRAEALAAAGNTVEALIVAQRAKETLNRFAQQIDDPDVLTQFIAYPTNTRIQTAVAAQRIPTWPD
jgi:DNA-binding SARP family transcriptional activator